MTPHSQASSRATLKASKTYGGLAKKDGLHPEVVDYKVYELLNVKLLIYSTLNPHEELWCQLIFMLMHPFVPH